MTLSNHLELLPGIRIALYESGYHSRVCRQKNTHLYSVKKLSRLIGMMQKTPRMGRKKSSGVMNINLYCSKVMEKLAFGDFQRRDMMLTVLTPTVKHGGEE